MPWHQTNCLATCTAVSAGKTQQHLLNPDLERTLRSHCEDAGHTVMGRQIVDTTYWSHAPSNDCMIVCKLLAKVSRTFSGLLLLSHLDRQQLQVPPGVCEG